MVKRQVTRAWLRDGHARLRRSGAVAVRSNHETAHLLPFVAHSLAWLLADFEEQITRYFCLLPPPPHALRPLQRENAPMARFCPRSGSKKDRKRWTPETVPARVGKPENRQCCNRLRGPIARISPRFSLQVVGSWRESYYLLGLPERSFKRPALGFPAGGRTFPPGS